MKTLDIVLLGGAIGFVAVGLWKYFNNAGIDPTTGGVPLTPGEVYGPAVPDSLAEGLQ